MKDKTNYITQEQFQKLLDNIGHLPTTILNHDQLLLLFQTLYEGAFRISEVLKLTPKDLDHEHKQFILRETKGGWKKCKCVKTTPLSVEQAAKFVKETNKRISFDPKIRSFKLMVAEKDCLKCLGHGKYRVKQYGWVSPELFDKLAKYSATLKNSDYLFPITRQMVWWYCVKLGDLVGVKMEHEEKETTNLFPHALRHTRAVHLASKLDINAVQKKMRHTDAKTTSIYTEISRKNAQELEFGS